MTNQHGICRNKAETFELLLSLVSMTPMTTIEIAEKMEVTKSAVHRYLTEFEKVKVVDWRYVGRALVAVFGVADESLTREQWFKMNGIPETKNERKKLANKPGGAPWKVAPVASTVGIPESIKKQLSYYGVPEKVRERFKHGASVVVFEGKKYTRESNHG